MRTPVMIVCLLLGAATGFGDEQPRVDEQPAVRVEPLDLSGPRPLADQTQQAVIRDYLEAWHSLDGALGQNRPDLLNTDFVGSAKDKLTDTIHQQTALGLHARYQDRSHDVRVVFYSPEGLSVQLVDNVEYDMQLIDQEKVLTTQRVHERYVVVLTPSEVRWRVRIFQGEPE
jgi:hypothetical protein